MMEDEKRNVDGLIQELRRIVQLKDDYDDERNSDIVGILDLLVNVSDDSNEDNSEGDIDDMFLRLLKHESSIVVAKSAKAIAEMARTENGRIKFTDSNLVKMLMNLMESEDIDILTQTSRALGNICYDNEKANKLVQDNDGLKYILDVLKRGVSLQEKDGAELLRNVAAGFLLNYLVDQKSLQQKAIEENLLSIICDVLEIDGINGGKAATHVLLTLEILNDSGIQFLNERLTEVLVKILANDNSSELSEICLELFNGQAENENAKILLAKSGVCESLLNLLEKHVSRCIDEESRGALKTACDLIVLIITGDESMNYLYGDSNGEAYKKLVTWLGDDCDQDLQVAAVLAMGNFARTDAHCKLMVEQNVHKKLLELLRKNSSNDGDIRLQHALLSAVRNLVIPNENKPIMLEDGLIDIVYPMLEIPTFPVVFKLLGTLRIVIDGQEETATLLGKKEDLIKKTIEWCSTEDHPGVQGEANRLLAWLVINSKNQDVVSLLIVNGAIEYLSNMIIAQHALMQNEALLSLTIITTMALNQCQSELIRFNIRSRITQFFLVNTVHSEPPIVENALTFMNTMIKSDTLREHLKTPWLTGALEEFLKKAKNMSTQKTKTKALLDVLNV